MQYSEYRAVVRAGHNNDDSHPALKRSVASDTVLYAENMCHIASLPSDFLMDRWRRSGGACPDLDYLATLWP